MQKTIFYISLAVFVIACQSSSNKNDVIPKYIDTAKFFSKEIPKYDDGKLDLFYLLAKENQKEFKLDSIENGYNGLEIRVWYEFSRVPERRLVIITNNDTIWQATSYSWKVNWDGEKESVNSKEIKQVTPKSGWPIFASKLLGFHITTLPDMNNISGYQDGKDGKMYNIEIASKNHYRFYSYWQPHDNRDKIQEAKDMSKILDLFNSELGVKP